MFTGIVQSVGRIDAVRPAADGHRIEVDAAGLGVADVAVGDSIAVNGCCLTVIAVEETTLRFDLSAESARCTAGLVRPGPVNLEKALRLSDRLGGHLMSGHVDGVGVVVRFEHIRPAGMSEADGGSVLLEIDVPPELARLVAAKGSIAVDGVSLTVNEISGRRFSVNLIPHTLAVTTLGALAAGAAVNLEVDIIARYVARLHDPDA
ncbi:MAG: riboflavin synthase [Pseudomonadota bacterium]|nr:riboflavin synthase [Pseudomonadota bacterium]